MSFKNNTCSQCQSVLSEAQVADIKCKQNRNGRIGAFFGILFAMIGTALGIYFGSTA